VLNLFSLAQKRVGNEKYFFKSSWLLEIKKCLHLVVISFIWETGLSLSVSYKRLIILYETPILHLLLFIFQITPVDLKSNNI
jgi:hypothetical protein